MCGRSSTVPLVVVLVACSLLLVAVGQSAVVVRNDEELLRAFQDRDVVEIQLGGPVRLGTAWDKQSDLVSVDRNVTLTSATPGSLPQLDFGFHQCKLLLQPGVVLRIVGLELFRTRLQSPSYGVDLVCSYGRSSPIEVEASMHHFLVGAPPQAGQDIITGFPRHDGSGRPQLARTIESPWCKSDGTQPILNALLHEGDPAAASRGSSNSSSSGRVRVATLPGSPSTPASMVHSRRQGHRQPDCWGAFIFVEDFSISLALPEWAQRYAEKVLAKATTVSIPMAYRSVVFVAEYLIDLKCVHERGIGPCTEELRTRALDEMSLDQVGAATEAPVAERRARRVRSAVAVAVVAVLASLLLRLKLQEHARARRQGHTTGAQQQPTGLSQPGYPSAQRSIVHSAASATTEGRGKGGGGAAGAAANEEAQAAVAGAGAADSSTTAGTDPAVAVGLPGGELGGRGGTLAGADPAHGCIPEDSRRRASLNEDGHGASIARLSPADEARGMEQAIQRMTSEVSSEKDKLILGALIGSGGYGQVYKASWKGLSVACKTLVFHSEAEEHGSTGANGKSGRKSMLTMVMTEAALAMALHHPNVVQTFHYEVRPLLQQLAPSGSHPELPPRSGGGEQPAMEIEEAHATRSFKLFLVQELCSMTLSNAVDARLLHGGSSISGNPNKAEVLHLLHEAARGIAYIHSKGIVHGDIKPQNMLLKLHPDGTCAVKVSDFGMARRLQDPSKSHISGFGGTMFYIAPEVAKDGKMSFASDVFSFGVCLWEVYSGTTPFLRGGEDGQYTLNKTFIAALADGTGPMPALARRCLQRRHKNRPTMSEVVAELAQMKASAAVPAAQGTSGSQDTSSMPHALPTCGGW